MEIPERQWKGLNITYSSGEGQDNVTRLSFIRGGKILNVELALLILDLIRRPYHNI